MRRVLPLLILPLLLSACGTVESYVQSAAAKMESSRNPNAPPRPGLEPLYQSPPGAERPQAATIAPPEPPDAQDLPFPPRLIGHDEAEALLAGDPAALRFLTMRRLAETGLVPAEDAAARAAANRGALLPLTTAEPPAAGLFLPLPPPAEIERMVGQLWNRPGGAAQRDFVVDNVLPRHPAQREAMSIADKQSARRALNRLDRLGQAGLVGPEQQQAEGDALRALIDGDALPETLVVAPPPEPVRPVKPKKTGKGRAATSGAAGAARMERLTSR